MIAFAADFVKKQKRTEYFALDVEVITDDGDQMFDTIDFPIEYLALYRDMQQLNWFLTFEIFDEGPTVYVQDGEAIFASCAVFDGNIGKAICRLLLTRVWEDVLDEQQPELGRLA